MLGGSFATTWGGLRLNCVVRAGAGALLSFFFFFCRKQIPKRYEIPFLEKH